MSGENSRIPVAEMVCTIALFIHIALLKTAFISGSPYEIYLFTLIMFTVPLSIMLVKRKHKRI